MDVLLSELPKTENKKHNWTENGKKKRSSEWKSWNNLKHGHADGICDQWKVFDNFYRDMGDKPSSKCSVQRKDQSKPYERDNCYWGFRPQKNPTPKKNPTPQKPTKEKKPVGKLYSYNGKAMTLRAWAVETNIPYETLRDRILADRQNLSFEEAIARGNDGKFKYKDLSCDGQLFDSVESFSKYLGVCAATVYDRLNIGMTGDEAKRDILEHERKQPDPARYIYFLVIKDEATNEKLFLKIGITNNPTYRLKQHSRRLARHGLVFETILVKDFKTEAAARAVEAKIKNNYIVYESGITGFQSECFMYLPQFEASMQKLLTCS